MGESGRFDGLARWVEASGGWVDPGVDLRLTAQSRTLMARREVLSGEALVRIPWPLAINLRSALRRLSADERRSPGRGAVARLGLRDLIAFLKGSPRVQHAATSLLVALQICSEARDPDSALRRYAELLPSPGPGGLLAGAVAGPRLVHPLLFDEADLDALQNESLKSSVARDRALLRHVYDEALRPEAVTFGDFLWSVAIVRSRSLNLSLHLSDRENGGAPDLQCMLPVIDMCDHSSAATCSLRCSVSPGAPGGEGGGEVTAIELFASSDLPSGSALTIDYGHRPLRDFLRVYGFTPTGEDECREEVYENPLEQPLESVLVSGRRGGGGGGFYSLRRVMVVQSLLGMAAEVGGSPRQPEGMAAAALAEKALLLDGAEGCACLYEVEDECGSFATEASFKDSPEVIGDWRRKGGRANRGGEASACARALAFCRGLQDAMPTTLEEDRGALAGAEAREEEEVGVAVRYRVARKALLERVADDLATALALLVSD